MTKAVRTEEELWAGAIAKIGEEKALELILNLAEEERYLAKAKEEVGE